MTFDRWFTELAENAYAHKTIWTGYFLGNEEGKRRPETCLVYLTPHIPDYIEDVFVVGCGSGSNFLTFDRRYRLYGTDIAPESEIHWIKQFTDLKYKCLAVEDTTPALKRADVDMSKVLVVSQGVLMYVSPDDQRDFYATCLSKGCKNFIFQEYPQPTTKHGDQCLHLGEHISDFLPKNYRLSLGREQPTAHINLDISAETLGQIYEQFIPKNVEKALTPRDHLRALLSAIRYKLLRSWRDKKT